MEVNLILDVLRLIIGSLILGYASYTDIKTRRADNILWLIMGVSGLIILIIQWLVTGFENYLYLIFVPLMIGFIYLLFQMRLIFGGADAKALMALAILAPLFPKIYGFPIFQQSQETIMPFPWIIFTNSVIMFLFVPLSLLIYNILHRNIEFPFIFLGYKTSIKKAKEKFVWPLERIVDGKRKFSYMPKKFDVEDDFKIFEEKGIKNIWVTPKVPFMIPLLAGYVCSFILGDILTHIMYSIM